MVVIGLRPVEHRNRPGFYVIQIGHGALELPKPSMVQSRAFVGREILEGTQAANNVLEFDLACPDKRVIISR